MILRELIAKLGLDLDAGAFDAADDRISGLRRGLEFAGQAAIAMSGALAVGLGVSIKAAADANETLNLMGLVFDENAESVRAWANEFAAAAGRSEFELREMATTLGSVLRPLLEDNAQLAGEFATALSARAVDFASARNVSDMEATQALVSGLTGETEPLKRFGIVMTVAALQAFALEQGITKSVAKMTEAEKTQLRYAFLMERTAIFAGDAANTSESFANATKALRASLVDLGTRIGLQFLPTAEKIVRITRNVVAVLGDWIEQSRIIQAAMIVFGGIAVGIAVAVGAAWALANLPIVLAAAALLALVLIVDDFLVFLEGGDSIIGAFIDSIWGPGSAAEAAANLKGVLTEVSAFLTDTFLPAATTAAGDAKEAFGTFFASLTEWFAAAGTESVSWSDILLDILDGITGALGVVVDAFDALIGRVLDLINVSKPLENLKVSIRRKIEDVTGLDLYDETAAAAVPRGEAPIPRSNRRGTGIGERPQRREAPIPRTYTQRGTGTPHPAVQIANGARTGGANAPAAAPSIAVPPSVRNDNRSAQSTTVNNSVSVTVEEGRTPRETGRRVATSTVDELRKMARHARAGLTQRAEAP